MWHLLCIGGTTSIGVFSLLSERGIGTRFAQRAGPKKNRSSERMALGTQGRVISTVLARVPALEKRYLEMQSKARDGELARLCEDQVPELLDILALGLSAGLSFDASVELYGARSDSVLAREMGSLLHSWRLGLDRRDAALERLAQRTSSPSLLRFASAVAESLTFGSPLAAVLERQADVIREEQRARVRQRVEEVPVRMLIPLGTLVVPAMLIAVVGPLLIAAFS